MKQEMMRWQWHQMDHMQIICTLLQTDNHASTSSLSFWATVSKTVRIMLSVCCLFVTLVYCGQTVGWIKMKLGMMEVGL